MRWHRVVRKSIEQLLLKDSIADITLQQVLTRPDEFGA
jgi:isocitrate dehydrogenase